MEYVGERISHREADRRYAVEHEHSPHTMLFSVDDKTVTPDSYPDPRDPDNLFKTSGRGVLIIHNVMDAVQYNERGNRITMVKKSDSETRKNLS